MSAPQTEAPTPAEHRGGWSPMRSPAFARFWSAQFVSNVGSWMQTVAAQWVMVSLTTSALLVSAIGAVGSLPVLLLAIPAGALGDLVDRRKLIVATQIVMLIAATGLALLAALDGLTPAVILALLFVIGCGSAASAPTWQTLQPELVPPADRQQAIALGSVNQNLARAVGPALGGVLLAATSAALVFGVNAFSFVAVVIAVATTAIPRRTSTLPREHTRDAIRAGARYVAFSPTLLALIARAALFILPASAIWALLPLVARGRLGLGAAYQSEMPSWVKARGMAYYLIAFQGSAAVGGLGFGAVAQLASVSTALLVVAACLVVAVLATWRLALPVTPGVDVQPGGPWPLPELEPGAQDSDPVLVMVRWPVRPEAESEYLAQRKALRDFRRRTGATHSRLYHEAGDRDAFVESFVLGSWTEHELQHNRVAVRDQDLLDRLEALLRAGSSREVHHYIAAR